MSNPTKNTKKSGTMTELSAKIAQAMITPQMPTTIEGAINEVLEIRKEVSEAILKNASYKDAAIFSAQTGASLVDSQKALEKQGGSLTEALCTWIMN